MSENDGEIERSNIHHYLIEAVKAEDIVECRRLIESEGADVHQKGDYDLSPILWGSLRGYLDIVELLISKGADVHDKSIIGCNTLMAASASSHINLLGLLLSNGASLHDVDNHGSTCFSLALNPDINPHPNRKYGLLYRLRKWPTTMAILVLTELALIYRIDSSSFIDLHQYIGKEGFTRDNEEEYTLDGYFFVDEKHKR